MLISLQTNIYCILTKETIILTNDLGAKPVLKFHVSVAAPFLCLRRFYGYAVSRCAVSMFLISLATLFLGFCCWLFVIVVVARNDSTLHLVINLERRSPQRG